MNYKQMLDKLQELEQRIKQLEDSSALKRTVSPTLPPKPWTLGCHICGLGSDGAMAYVCARPDCPTKVTCVNPQDGF